MRLSGPLPEMLQLLKEVEAGEYDAVLVMNIDRFGCGNMQEQGIILETIPTSGIKIITPRKTYDLMDEFEAADTMLWKPELWQDWSCG